MTKTLKYLAILFIILSMAACSKKNAPFVAPLVQFEPTVGVNTVWTTSVGGGNQKEYLKLTPTLYGGQIYTATYNGQISIVDAQTGKRVWHKSLKDPISSGISADNAMLYVGTRKGEVIAVNRQDGRVVWRTPVSNEVLATPNAVNGMVLVKTIDDHVYALNKQNGQVIWSYHQPAPEMILRGGTSPQVQGGVAAVGFADGTAAAFNSQQGDLLWINMVARPSGISVVEQMVDVVNAMVVSDGVVYVASYQGAIAAIGLHSGEIFWEQKISSYAGLALDAHHVYASDASGHVSAFNRRNGHLLWKQDRMTGRGITGPAVLGDTVVVADKEGFVHWMSTANGQFVARTRPDGSGIIANPVSDGSAVYIYTNSGRLVKYR